MVTASSGCKLWCTTMSPIHSRSQSGSHLADVSWRFRIRQLDTIECVSVYGLRASGTMIIASASTIHAAALAKRRVAIIVIPNQTKWVAECGILHGFDRAPTDRKPSRHCRHSIVPVSNGQA